MNKIRLNISLIIICLLVALSFVGCSEVTSDTDDRVDGTTTFNFEAQEESEIQTDIQVDIIRAISPYSMSTSLTQTPTSATSRTLTRVVKNSLAPILLEVDSIGGTSFKGLIFGVSRERFETSLEDAKLRIKAKMIRVDNVPVYIGTAIALVESNTTSTAKVPLTQTTHKKLEGVAWTFIAIPPDKTLSGPQVGRVFQVYGQTNIQAICLDDKVDGMFNLKNIKKGVNLSGIFVTPLPNAALCDRQVVSGVAKSSQDLKVISTHIGPVLSGEGFLSVPAKGVKGVDIYSLSIAQRLDMNGDIVDTKLTSTTHALDPEAAKELLGFRDNGDAVFESLKGNLYNLKEGDFIVSKPRPRFPNGFLRKVDTINTINGKVVVSTSQGYIGDILEEANIDINRSFDIVDVEEGYDWYDKTFDPTAFEPIVLKNTSRATPRKVENDFINIPFNKVIYDNDGDHATKDDQIAVKGNLNFGVNAKVKLACSGFLCSKPDFVAKFTADETGELELVGNIKWSKGAVVDLPPTLVLPPISVFPLVFIPSFTSQLKVNGELSASIEYSATQELEFTAGVEYTPDDGWTDLSGFDKSYTNLPPVYYGEIDARAELVIKASFMLYGVAGVYSDLGGYVNFNAGIRDPAWELRGGITSNIGVDLDVIIWSEQFGYPVLDESWQIAKSVNMPPVITLEQPTPLFSGPVHDKIVVLGGEIRIDFNVADPEGETGFLVKLSSNIDGDMGTGKDVVGSMYYTFKNEGVHRITATATDSKGLVGTVSIDVEVVDVDFDVDPGIVTSNIPSSVRDNGLSTSLEIVIEPNSDTDIDKVEWWIYDQSERKSTPNGTLMKVDPTPELIGITTESGASQTHRISYKFEYSAGDAYKNIKNINAYIYFTKAGVPSQVEYKTYELEIKNELLAFGEVKDISISNKFDIIVNSVDIGEEVIFTPELTTGTADKCKTLSWSSSNSDDGVDGVYYPSLIGEKVLSFSTSGKRTITATISTRGCADSSFSKEINVINSIGGGFYGTIN